MNTLTRSLFVSIGIATAVMACRTSTAPTDAGARDAHPLQGGDSGERANSAPPSADASRPCERPVARLCVFGVRRDGGATEELRVGAPVRFLVAPIGCFSSSGVPPTVGCEAEAPAGGIVRLTADFCGKPVDAGAQAPEAPEAPQVAPTADCGGGGVICERALRAGAYTATIGGLSLAFTVPGSLPLGGSCVDSQH